MERRPKLTKLREGMKGMGILDVILRKSVGVKTQRIFGERNEPIVKRPEHHMEAQPEVRDRQNIGIGGQQRNRWGAIPQSQRSFVSRGDDGFDSVRSTR
jgi:hypothetical protein